MLIWNFRWRESFKKTPYGDYHLSILWRRFLWRDCTSVKLCGETVLMEISTSMMPHDYCFSYGYWDIISAVVPLNNKVERMQPKNCDAPWNSKKPTCIRGFMFPSAKGKCQFIMSNKPNFVSKKCLKLIGTSSIQRSVLDNFRHYNFRHLKQALSELVIDLVR
jgi:hypothetical protein